MVVRPEHTHPELKCPTCAGRHSEFRKDFETIGDCPKGCGTYHEACWIYASGCAAPTCPHQTDGGPPPRDLDNKRPGPGKTLLELQNTVLSRNMASVRTLVAIAERNPWLEDYPPAAPVYSQVAWARDCFKALQELDKAISRGQDQEIIKICDRNKTTTFAKLSDFDSRYLPDLEKARRRAGTRTEARRRPKPRRTPRNPPPPPRPPPPPDPSPRVSKNGRNSRFFWIVGLTVVAALAFFWPPPTPPPPPTNTSESTKGPATAGTTKGPATTGPTKGPAIAGPTKGPATAGPTKGPATAGPTTPTVPKCNVEADRKVTARSNATLWSQSEVTASTTELLAEIKQGAQLTILSTGAKWEKIRFDLEYWGWMWQVRLETDGTEGWIWQGRIAECDDQPTLEFPDGVYLRAGPGTECAIVGSAPSGDTATVIGQSADGQWYKIDNALHKGVWVSSIYPLVRGPSVSVQILEHPPCPLPLPGDICKHRGMWTDCGGWDMDSGQRDVICEPVEVGYCQDDKAWICKPDPGKCVESGAP